MVPVALVKRAVRVRRLLVHFHVIGRGVVGRVLVGVGVVPVESAGAAESAGAEGVTAVEALLARLSPTEFVALTVKV